MQLCFRHLTSCAMRLDRNTIHITMHSTHLSMAPKRVRGYYLCILFTEWITIFNVYLIHCFTSTSFKILANVQSHLPLLWSLNSDSSLIKILYLIYLLLITINYSDCSLQFLPHLWYVIFTDCFFSVVFIRRGRRWWNYVPVWGELTT